MRAGPGTVRPAVVALVAALVALLLATGAGAAVAAPAGEAPRAPTDAGGVTLTVEDVAPVVLEPGRQLSLRVRAQDPSGTALEGARVLLYASTVLQGDAAALQRWADGDGDVRGNLPLEEVELRPAGEAPSAPPAAGRGATDVVTEVVADPVLTARLGAQWGPRGLTVELQDAGGERIAAARTFVVWLPRGEPAQRTALTVLVPFSAGPPAVADARVPAERMEEQAALGGRLDRLLRVASDPGVAWALDPAVLGPPAGAAPGPAPVEPPAEGRLATEPSGPAAAATDPSATGVGPATAAWRERLRAEAPRHEVVALPQGVPDLEGLARAGLGEVMTLAEQQGAATVQAGLPVGVRSDVAWATGRDPSAAAVDLARAAGRTAVVLGSADEDDGLPARVDLPLGGAPGGAVAGLVPSAAASTALVEGTTRGAGGAPGAVTPAVAAARLLAESAVVARGGPGDPGPGPRPMLLAPAAGWDVEPAAAEAVLEALRAAPWVEPASLADLVAAPVWGGADALAAGGAGAAQLPAEGLRQVADALARARTTASAIAGEAERASHLAEVEASAVAATSAAWLGDPEGWRAGLAALTASGRSVDRGVQVLPGSAVNVLATEVGLPVTVANDLDRAVDVAVSVRSLSARLAPGDPVVVAGLAPGDREQVRLPVTAVASGDITVQVLLTTLDGTAIGEPAPLTVRVRAEWETRGTAVAAGVLGLVLLAGLVRAVRRGRGGGRRPRGPAGGPVGGGPVGGRPATAAGPDGEPAVDRPDPARPLAPPPGTTPTTRRAARGAGTTAGAGGPRG